MVNNPIQKDLARLGIPIPDLPRIPKLPFPTPLSDNPTTPFETLTSIPSQISDFTSNLVEKVEQLPLQALEDVSVFTSNTLRLPQEAIDQVASMPQKLISSINPKNLGALVEGMFDNLQFRNISPSEFQQRTRTFNDFIPFT